VCVCVCVCVHKEVLLETSCKCLKAVKANHETMLLSHVSVCSGSLVFVLQFTEVLQSPSTGTTQCMQRLGQHVVQPQR
jgi:hypothetical protein